MTLSVTVLGATGSIGVSTLDVIARHPERYRVYALTGHSRMAELADQCRQHRPDRAVVATSEQAVALQQVLREAGLPTEVSWGEDALADVASVDGVDVVMAAIVGAAGLRPTLAAAQATVATGETTVPRVHPVLAAPAHSCPDLHNFLNLILPDNGVIDPHFLERFFLHFAFLCSKFH